MSLGNGIDDGIRTGYGISAGKHTWDIGRHRGLIRHKCIPAGNIQTVISREEGQVRLLTDGRNDDVGFNDKFRTFYRHGTSSPTLIGFTQFHFQAFHSGYFAVLADNLNRRCQIMNLYAFIFGFFDLGIIGGHFFAGTPIYNMDFFTFQPDSSSCSIDGRIPTTDYDDFISGLFGFIQINSS